MVKVVQVILFGVLLLLNVPRQIYPPNLWQNKYYNTFTKDDIAHAICYLGSNYCNKGIENGIKHWHVLYWNHPWDIVASLCLHMSESHHACLLERWRSLILLPTWDCPNFLIPIWWIMGNLNGKELTTFKSWYKGLLPFELICSKQEYYLVWEVGGKLCHFFASKRPLGELLSLRIWDFVKLKYISLGTLCVILGFMALC